MIQVDRAIWVGIVNKNSCSPYLLSSNLVLHCLNFAGLWDTRACFSPSKLFI